MSPERVMAVAAQINAGKSAGEAFEALGLPSRSAAISEAARYDFHFGTAIPPEKVAFEASRFAPVLVEPDVSSVPTLARSLLAEHRLVQRALPLLIQAVNASSHLRAEVLDSLIEAQCRRVLETAMQSRHQEETRKRGAGPVGAQRSSDMTGWAAQVADSLMDDFKLPSGVKLGDATRADLDTAMAVYQIQIADAEVKFRWLRLVAQSLPQHKTVREHLTNERLNELRAEARKVEA